MLTRRAYAAVMVSSLLVLGGCLDVDSKLNADGSGKMTVSYTVQPTAMGTERSKLEGPHVKVTSSEHKGSRGVFELTFDDATKINTSKFFRNVTVKIEDAEGGNKTVTTTIVNDKPQKLNDEVTAKVGKEVHIAVEFPGDVVTSNASFTSGKTAKWVYATSDFTSRPDVILKATYKNPAAAGAPAAAPSPKPSAPNPSAPKP